MFKKFFIGLLLVVCATSTVFAAQTTNTRVLLQTNLGNIELELADQQAPITTKNFITYVNSGFYNGLVFHRVIPGFMIQGGGFTKDMVQKTPNDPIVNEAQNGLQNKRGTISMARTNVVNSATSQFFINLVDNDFLNYTSDNNYGYAVFGKVIKGMDIVDEIGKVKTHRIGVYSDVPVAPVTIISATVMK